MALNYKEEALALIKNILNTYGLTEDDLKSQANLGATIYQLVTENDYRTAHAQIIEREGNVITAQNTESLYKHASASNVAIVTTTPSYTDLLIGITFDDIKLYGNKEAENEYIYTFTRDNTFMIGSYPYTLDNDVEIRLLDTLPNPIIGAKYKEVINSRKPSNDALEVQTTIMNYKDVVLVKIRVYQYKESIQTFFINNNIFDSFNVSVENQLVDFRVSYMDTETSPEQVLDPVIYYGRDYGDNIGYKYTSNKSLNLFHRDRTGGFKPKIGGILKVYLRESYGMAANFKYSYRPTLINTNPKMAIFVDSIDNISTGGIDFNMGDEKFRREIISSKSFRYVMTIENDLDSALLPYNNDNLKLESVLYRNDIRRIFNLFANLTFKQEDQTFIIPSTTATVNVEVSKLNKKEINGYIYYNYSPKDHFILVEKDKVNAQYNLYRKEEIDLEDEENVNKYLSYYAPFFMSYNFTNNEIISYFANCEKTFEAKVDYTSENSKLPFHFIVRRITTSYDVNGNLKLRFHVRTNIENKVELHSYTEEGEIQDLDLCRVYIQFKGKVPHETTEGSWKENIYRVKAKMVEYIEEIDNYIYEVEFDTDMTIYNKSIDVNNVEFVETIENKSYKDGKDAKELVTGNFLLNQSITVQTELKVEDTYYLTNTYKLDIELLEENTKYFHLQSAIQMGEPITVKLMLLPLIMCYFYDIKEGRDILYNKIQEIMNAINQVLPYIKNLYNIDLKFNNTSAYSKFLVVGTNNRPLLSLHMKPSFLIRTKETVYDINRLRSLIASYINSVDYKLEPFHVTNLEDYIMEVEYKQLKFIQFMGFEDYDLQDQLISDSGAEVENDSILESVSIKLKFNEETKLFEYDIPITLI